MTSSQESDTEISLDSEFTASSSDEVRAQLIDDVDDPESLAKSLGVLVPVRVDRGSLLPQQAELKVGDSAQSLEQVRADIAADMPEQASEASVAQRMVERQNVALEDLQISQKVTLAKVRDAIAGARDFDELKGKIESHLADYNLVTSPDGWFTAMPGDREAELILSIANQERTALERRGTIERARDTAGRAFDAVSEARQARLERKEHDEILKEAHAENDARDRAERVKEEERAAAEKDASAERGRKIGEDRKRDQDFVEDLARRRMEYNAKESIKIKPLEEQITERQDAATQKLVQEIIDMRQSHAELRSRAERRGIGEESLKQIDADFYHAIGEIRKQIDGIKKNVEEKVRAESLHSDKVRFAEARAILAFQQDDKPGQHIFKPDSQLTSEMAAKVAGENAGELGKQTPPTQVDEYIIGKTTMQRIVYRTVDADVVIVEDWDKTSGKLKRQSIVRGKGLLIPDYENDKLGRLATRRRKNSGESRLVLSNDVYANLGDPVTADAVSGDSDTLYSEGYSNYTQNLVRSGNGGLMAARELAGHNFKTKQSKKFKGFIATLQEEFTNKSAASKKK